MTQPTDGLSPAKQALREARLRGRSRAQPMTRRAGEGDPPLSFAQERLWFVDRLQPGSTAYNLCAGLRLAGGVDERALERALGEIVRRHEALRTTFREVDGVPVQAIAPFGGFTLPVEDLSGLSPEAREAEVRRYAARERAHVFDLSAGPLFRATLLRLGEEEHVLFLGSHHIVGDAWSQKVLEREIHVLHGAYREGRESPLPELPVQYADYAAWQRSEGTGAESVHLAYWRRQLAGAPELLALPADRPRPPAPSSRGARVPVAVSLPVVERLRELAQSEGATLHMVVLGAFQVLLSKYSGSEDVVVGSPVAGRTRREVEGLVGLFVNTVVLRTDLSGDPRFREVAGRVREVALGAYQHQDLPFERVVAELRPERTLSHSPLFQVMFALEDAAKQGAGGEGPWRRVEAAEPEATQFDLTLSLAAHPRGLSGALEYSTELFERDTIARMAAHLVRVLEQAAGDPEVRLSGVELLGAAEREQVLAACSGPDRPLRDAPLHAIFAEQARRAPDAAALLHAGGALTYAALDRRAEALARRLRALGVGPDTPVGLCVEPSSELLAGILGIWKAGGAYLPLDPAYPAERLRWMVSDAALPVVVTAGSAAAALPEHGARVVRLDGLPGEAEPLAGGGEPPLPPSALAYVIYTSGSTGAPKGVMVPHRGVANLLAEVERRAPLSPGDRCAVWTSVSFDVSVYEIFSALLHGGTLLFPPAEVRASTEGFLDWMEAHGVRSAYVPPFMLPALAERLAERPGSSALRRLLVGVEPIPERLLQSLRRSLPGLHVVNGYGPTEATICATLHSVEPRAVSPEQRTPIGRPVQNTRAYVLDGALHPTPAGIPGELYVGGSGVARGYLARPGLTAERWIPDPFGAEPGARLYRTGDRVRRLAGGELEFLGRVDEQVKVRGFRIEPGEIEAVLRGCPGVREARVVAREDEPGERRLVAYVVGEAEADGVRAQLRRSLPEHMVPGTFVVLERLPLTPNGKLDVRALPAPGPVVRRHVEPRTPVEAALAEIWAEVLRLERVGVEEGFFELGGDSILSIQVVSRARRAGLDLTPRQMVEHQTIAELAAVAGRSGGAAARSAEQGRVEGSVRLTPIQAWFLEQDQPAPWHFNQALALEVDAGVGGEVLEAALRAVLEHHDALRLRFRQTESGWEQWHAAGVGIGLERVDLSGLRREAQERAQREIAHERQASLHLERGPLGRAVLFDRGERGRLLLLVMHHLVVDGVSWRILRDDLERACAQAESGGGIHLGEKTTSYREWAETLERYAASGALEEEAAYWRAQGPEGVPPLPVDGEGGHTVGDARTVTVRLGAEETRALLHEVPAAYRTQVNDVLLCALAEAFGGWTGSPRVRIALEGHGREEEVGDGVDLTRTVGWFTSLYPVVLDVAGAAGPGERLKRVKEQLRAVPRRGIGYGVLRHLSPDAGVRRALSAHPEPEVVFNYLGQTDQGLLPARRLRSSDEPRGRSWAVENRRSYPLGVDGNVVGGSLQLSWAYSEGVHRRETIERVAGAYVEALRGLIAHCCEEGAGGYTPSDFPLAELTQGEMDTLLEGRRGVEDLYPLSPMQEGILFHTLSGGEPQAYQVQAAMLLEGSLDPELFRRAWAEVVGRHAVLRTAFMWRGLRSPLQRVESAVELPWVVEDWRDRSPEEQEAALEQYLAEDRARGFVLDEAPLMRCALFRVGDGVQWFVLNQHHLLLDGWTGTRLRTEAFRLYEAWSAGGAEEPQHVRRYRDYVAWLKRQDQGAAERYWREVLAGFAAPTPLGGAPAAGPGGARYAKRSVALSAELTRRLGEAARRLHVTLNTVVQGAWGLLLSRYSGEEDVVFGATVSGRPPGLVGAEEMVGLFINTLPVRVCLPGDARLGAWLGELQRAQAEAREYEYAPLVQVQRWSDVPPGMPLFESLVIFENYPGERSGAGGEGVRVTRTRAVEWTNYPLTLVAHPGRELRLGLSYDEGRFEAGAAGWMLHHLERVLEQIADDADARLFEVELLGKEERARVLEEWSRTDAGPPADACVHELFEAQAARTPDAVAVVHEGEPLTYAELNARAGRLARRLGECGVRAERAVGVCAEPGAGMLVGVLACWKAGGVFVPLDPAYPRERLALVLEDAEAVLVLVEPHLEGVLPPHGGRTLLLDERGGEDASAEGERGASSPGVHPGSLAYLIHTSGSTGRPKGVAVEHRSVAGTLRASVEAFGFGAGEVIPSLASFAFDIWLFESFCTLLSGGAVLPVARERVREVEALPELLREATALHAVPALMRLLLEAVRVRGEGALPRLRKLFVGGDAVAPELLEEMRAAFPGAEVRVLYGPTEGTVICASHAAAGGEGPGGRMLGRPLGSARLYVLDANGHPLPAGVPGELCIGGPGVARGYHAGPEPTAERFVPDPFSGVPGGRMYRSGDRVRWMAGGELEFLGRVDRQVKVRGFRIEPGEIEAALRGHAAVDDVVVLAREDAPGARRLVAYWVGGEEEVEALRAHLSERLPEHMVPAAYVRLDALPLTPNGKVDRGALSAPEGDAFGSREHEAPRGEVEEALAEVWAEVLGVERVGRRDNFFELGGHSLLAVTLIERMRRRGLHTDVRALFTTPTLADLAAAVGGETREVAVPENLISPDAHSFMLSI